MSRLIKKPIALKGATITLQGDVMLVKGSKGELSVSIPKTVTPEISAEELTIGSAIERGSDTALQGTFWALAKNAIEGVTEGFTKVLEIEGVGYRAAIEGKELVLWLGYALPVRMAIPADVAIAVEKNTIKVSGIDKDAVGRAAANIRALKKPEPYKGKGIRYQGEVIRRKVGKKAGASAA